MAELFLNHLLSWTIALPVLGMGVLVFLRKEETIRRVALGCTLLDFALSLLLWLWFDPSIQGMQFVERMAWMPTLNIQYAIGVDGISLPLVLLSTLLSPLCVLCSWRSIEHHQKAFLMLLLFIESAMLLVFSTLDLFLFFMLWETTTMPMFFIIGVWGGSRRITAAIKFALFGLTGSLLLLVGILGLYLEGGRTFDMQVLASQHYPVKTQLWIFACLFLAFAIKTPMVPFHSWLPDAHTEAPNKQAMILAGVFLKMGGYGFVRLVLPMLPEATSKFTPVILWLSLLAILYGGYMALAQEDLKRLVAYSSISHMGFVTLGLFVANHPSIQGALLQMLNHGITTGAMFLVVGQLYDRTHSRLIEDYGGLHQLMPRFTLLLSIFAVASFGLPGTNNFIGEFLVLVGTAQRSLLMVLLAMGGILLGAAYLLWMLQRVALGPVPRSGTPFLPDLTPRELVTVIPLAVLVFWIGLYPRPFLELIQPGVATLLRALGPSSPALGAPPLLPP